MRLFRGRPALRLWCSSRRRLVLLHLFLLGGMLLLHLLRLLRVALLHLLFFRVVVVFRGGLLMFFVLLLLIFLVGCSVARVGRRELVRLQFAGVIVGVGTSFRGIFRTIFRAGSSFISWTRFIAACSIGGGSLVFAYCLSGVYNAIFEITVFDGSRDGRLALVGGSAQFGIIAGCLNVLRLCGDWTSVVLASVRLFLRCGTRFNPTGTTVVADMSCGDVGHSRVVCVVNDGGVYVIHVSVVGEVATFPAATFVSNTAVAEAVVDAAVEAHLRAPIPLVEKECAAPPAPITWGP